MADDDKLAKRIQKRAEQILHDKLKPIVKQVVKDVSNEIRSAIERFYDDEFSTFYDTNRNIKGHTEFVPYTYQRQYGLQDMYNVSTKRTPLGYIINFRFAADLETAQHIRWSGKTDEANEAVFELNFIQGYHGGYMRDKSSPKGWRYPRVHTLPSPYDQIREYIENYKVPEV